MKNKILTALNATYPIEAASANFSAAYSIAKDWAQDDPSTEAAYWYATSALLCGKLPEVEEVVNRVLIVGSLNHTEKEIGELLKECILYDRFERMPGEISTPFADVEAAKARSNYFWALKSILPENSGDWAELIQLLNQHRKMRDWRVSRNLLAGSDITFLQNEFTYCNQEADKGHIVPILALAGFYKWHKQQYAMAPPLEIARSIVEKKQSPNINAEYLLFEGDRLATPAGSPVLWNFTMQSTHFNPTSELHPLVEDGEFQQPTNADMEQALRHYIDAENLFMQTDSSRGQGHIALRCAYFAFVEEEYATAYSYSELAGERFSKAGDACFSNLAKTYSAILLAIDNKFGEAGVKINEIANWNLTNRQCSWAAGLGHLINRVARHFSIRKSDTEHSLRLYRLAREFHKIIGYEFAAAQNNIDLAKLHERTGHTLQASNLYIEGLEEMNTFFEKTEKLNLDAFNRSLALLDMCTLSYQYVNMGIQKANHEIIEKGLNIATKTKTQLRNATKFDPSAQFYAMEQLNTDYKALEGNAQVLSAIYRAKAEREKGNENAYHDNILKAERILNELDLPKDMSGLLKVKIAVARDDREKAREYGLDCANIILTKSVPTIFGLDFNTASGQYLQQNHDYHSINQIFSLLIRLQLYKEAEQWYEKLCAQFGAQWWKREKYPWLEISSIAEMYEGLGDNNGAMIHYEEAINLFEQYRSELTRDDLKTAIADMQNMVYTVGYAIRCAFKVNQQEKAFRYAEGAKARSLLDLMQENRILEDTERGVSPLLYSLREKNARRSSLQNIIHKIVYSNQDAQQLQKLKAELSAVEVEITKIEEKIGLEYPGDLSWKNAIMQPSDIQSVADNLEENKLLITYFYSGDELFIWAVSKLGLLESRMIEIKDWKVKSGVELMRKAIVDKDKNWKSLADKLSRLLLEPISTHIINHKQLIFVLHGALQGLPMHILEVQDGWPIGFTHSISYLPGTGAMNFMGDARVCAAGKLLAIGNPTGDLKAASAEVRQISMLFPNNAQIFVDDEAGEKAIKEQMASAQLLHFATHGKFYEDNPMDSSLSLANGEEITVNELLGINLQAELVVLSACNSGRGQQTAGDELIGLSRALVAGGAKAAVVTYWQVDDIATSLWMKRFYTELKNGSTAAESARTAQYYLSSLTDESLEEELSQMWKAIDPINPRDEKMSNLGVVRDIGLTEINSPQDFNHPYYWGAFSVISR